RLVFKKTTYALDLGGKTPQEFRQQLLDPTQRFEWKPPAVEFVLEIRNISKEEVTIRVGGDDAESILDLKGPGAYSYTMDNAVLRLPIGGKLIKLAPGKSHALPFKSLTGGISNLRVQSVFWTEPGDYTLSASYRLAISPPPKDAKDAGNGL